MSTELDDLLAATAQYELEKFLHSPQRLPVHDFRKAQRLWPREPDTLSLFTVSVTAPHTDIILTRDPLTGAHVGFSEVHNAGGDLTAKNSTSMQRAPGPPTKNIKGESTDLPFWPGGLEEPDIVAKVVADEADFIDFENNLETVPPGFQHGIEFDQPKSTTSPGKSAAFKSTGTGVAGSNVPTLADLLAVNVFELDDWNYEEDEDAVVNKTDITEGIGVVDDDGTALKELELPEEELAPVKPAVEPTEQKSTKQWAIQVDLGDHALDEFHSRIPHMAHKWNFELDPFQKMAILHLHSHDNVFVAAHTSAGKTVIAEYAVALSRDHMTRTIYTSPIKALSNQKFRDFRLTFGENNVGLLTGDVQIKKEAPFLIMTTEILRSMLYTGSDVIRDVEWVIFDEVHYINDVEVTIITTPVLW